MTFQNFIDEMIPMHNQICVLYHSDIVRLVGVGQSENDYYYIVRTMKKEKGRDQEYWGTAVGHCLSLKGLYPDDGYASMDDIHTLNGAGPTEEFLIVDQTAKDYVCEPADPKYSDEAPVDVDRMLSRLVLSRFEPTEIGMSYSLITDDPALFAGHEDELEHKFSEEVNAVSETHWFRDVDANQILFTFNIERMRNDTLGTLKVERRLAEENLEADVK
jgi:hypothetical protein